MSTIPFYVTASADDYQTGDNANTDAVTMDARYIRAFDPPAVSQAVFEVTVSGLPAGAIIDAVTVWWYTDDYTKSRGTTYNQRLQMWDGSAFNNIWSATPASAPSGIESYSLTAAQIAANFNPDGVNKFRFTVDDPVTAGESRDWAIRTYDYSGLTYAPFIVVEYTLGAVKTQVIFL